MRRGQPPLPEEQSLGIDRAVVIGREVREILRGIPFGRFRSARELLKAEVALAFGGKVLNAKLRGPMVHFLILMGFIPRFEVIGGIHSFV